MKGRGSSGCFVVEAVEKSVEYILPADLNPPGESGDSTLIELCYPIDTQTAIEDSLQFHRRHISAVFIQAPVVEPVQIRGRFHLDVTRIPPRPPRLDQLRLVQPVDGFSERIIMRIANRTDRLIPNVIPVLGYADDGAPRARLEVAM